MSENHDSDGGEGCGGTGGSSAPVPDPNSLQAFGLSFGQSFGQAFGQALGEQFNQGSDPSWGTTRLQRPAFDPASAVTPAVAQALATLAQPGRQIIPREPGNGPEHRGNRRAEEADVAERDEELLNSRAESSALREQVAQLQEDRQSSERAAQDAQWELSSLREKVESLEDKIRRCREDKGKDDRTIAAVNTSLERCKKLYRDQGEELTRTKALIEANAQDLSRVTALKNDSDANCVHLRADLVHARDSLAGLAQASLDSKNAEYKDVRDKMLSFRGEANQLKATLARVESSLADAQQECRRLTSDLETANAAFSGADEKRQSLDKELGLVRNSYVASEERNFQLQTKNTDTLAHLEAERNKSKSREAELALSRESYRAISERRDELKSQLGRTHSFLRQFLMGPMTLDAGWVSDQVKIMLSEESMVLIERSPETMSVWELLPPWYNGPRGQIAAQDLNGITLQLVILFRSGCWDMASGAYEVLYKLKASLLDSSTAAIPRWMGTFFFSVLSWAVLQASSAVVVRISAWQILWLLYQQWPRVCDKTFLEEGVNPICRALRNGRPDFAGLDSYDQLKSVGPFDLVCPPDKSGVLVLDSAARTMRWVAMELVSVSISGVELSPPDGPGESAIKLEPDIEQLVWAFRHLR
ncbi:hypothetical protein FALBO_13381 [Fusarium albosuccineum]|uniref:Uncharacterized protein n=1 Tax=Fusarium albosuccineum TaxID=1237068 RepID=A0A8H4L1C6_9HYPO|nr:hypothetical protein FALBO_13381 [Fusarium albosuccineum]